MYFWFFKSKKQLQILQYEHCIQEQETEEHKPRHDIMVKQTKGVFLRVLFRAAHKDQRKKNSKNMRPLVSNLRKQLFKVCYPQNTPYLH